ncbi:hypothetical protein E4M02_01875 [Brevundimonas sp. S30B]|uniref:hypothetical protein n=1 Tax=unclassified Brevundimonas TaxID=2622653 RepID=UPI0010720AA3|nr:MULTISPECIES: hypothetical protein [unclassified Brevundimonas]QBX37351.1 hypothetical protein E4M01_05945 [Brevundimonas sp. MF30-B]TFW03856.1 hypothetical protein E4M02_01875 [Brevundimonas sp. S30B]
MRFIPIAVALALLAPTAEAQTPAPAPQAASNPAHAADVASADAIIAALYDVISGDQGQARDWDRFRTLFHPTGRLMPIGPLRDSRRNLGLLTPEQYVERAGPGLIGQGFHEREIARRVERFGGLTHVFSTYEARRASTDAEPFLRGINSIQLFDDGQRWWIVSVYWQAEEPSLPLPPQYLPD